MNQISFKIILITCVLSISLFAKENFTLSSTNEIHFLPKQNKEVKEKIVDLIKGSKESIYVSMYNFSYKKFAKALVKASKKGVDITVVLDKSKVEKDDEIYKLLNSNNIKTIIPKEKLHTKLAIFDEKIIVLGSSNWTKDSFKKNYEVILFSKDQKIIKKSLKFLNSL